MRAASLPLSLWNDEAHRERLWSALGAAAVHALIAYALIVGLAFKFVPPSTEELKTFDVIETPPPPPVEPPAAPPRPRVSEPEAAAAPPNLPALPSPIVVPKPKIRLEVAQRVGAAPVAGPANATSAGASPLPGPGTGAGGTGTGLGSGGAGSGTGTGGGGIATRARLIGGSIEDRDYPRGAYHEQIGGVVVTRLAIGADGRVTRCTVNRSSGNRELDETTCRLIEQRFRFAPARDAAGRAVASEFGWRQTWWLEGRRSRGSVR